MQDVYPLPASTASGAQRRERAARRSVLCSACRRNGRTLPGVMLFRVILVAVSVMLAEPAPVGAQQESTIHGRIHSSGSARYVRDRWGTVKGVVVNPTEEPQSILLLVTPPGGRNIQYARRITLPSLCSFETSWPVLIPADVDPQDEFRTLVFPGGEEDGVIRRNETDIGVASFSAVIRNGADGYTGWLSDIDAPREEAAMTTSFLQVVRFLGYRESAVVSVLPREFAHFPEALDSFDQLCVTSKRIAHHPQLASAIRQWVQRGGRLILMLDRTGMDAADQLLGEAFPATLVGETSSNTIRLDINPDYSAQSFPDREVAREFDEPVRYLRVLAESGETIWSVDGWPVATRVPFGRGHVLVTMIEPSAFLVPRAPDPPNPRRPASETTLPPPYDLIPSSRRMAGVLLDKTQPLLLDGDTVLRESVARIGYHIPGRWIAGLVALAFPVALLLGGLWLQRRQLGERLMFLAPLLAVAIAIPVISVGVGARSVSPQTTLQTHVIQSIPGQATLVSDGYAVTFNPDAGPVEVRGSRGAIVGTPGETDNTDLRRLVWTTPEDSEWVNLSLPSGIQLTPVQSLFRTDARLDATATFDEDGVSGTIDTGAFQDPTDAVFAGTSTTRMHVQWLSDNQFRIQPRDALRKNLFVTDALLSDDQLTHVALYEKVFDLKGRTNPFPEVPSVFCWVRNEDSPIRIGRGESNGESVLLVLPLRLVPPELNQTVTIPSGFVPFRSIPTISGSVSSAFNNNQREWIPSESAGMTLLEFSLPSVCRPFQAERGDLTLRIRAGSRKISVSAGTRESLEPLKALDSPVGVFDIPIPAERFTDSVRSGRIVVGIEASEIDASAIDPEAIGEQDDSWLIESLQLTLVGKRIPAE